MTNETMTKTELVRRIEEAWEAWRAALTQVGEARMLEKTRAGDWTIKDLVAHITWSEREMAQMLAKRSLAAGSPLWELDQDERNQRVYEANRERPPGDILAEELEVHEQLTRLLGEMTDEELNDPGQFAEMPSSWVPWRVIAGNTYRHYEEHLQDLVE